LAAKDAHAAVRAADAIKRRLAQLEAHPEIGRPYREMPELRELVIAFGDSGYVALYRYMPLEDAVSLLA
jgi:plasmid stabilization system protein ParE